MKRKHEQIDIPLLPDDVIGEIVSFIHYGGANWLNLRLVCKTWLKICKRIQDPSRDCNIALYLCAQRENFVAVNALLDDPRVSFQDRAELPKLLLNKAVTKNQTTLVKRLLKLKGIDPKLDEDLLSDAMEEGAVGPAIELLAHPDVIFWPECYTHPLEQAAELGLWQLIKPILKHSLMREIDVESYSKILPVAAQENSWLVIRAMLKYTDADPRRYESTFSKPIKKGHVEAVRELLKYKRTSVKAKYLKCAAQNNQTEMVKFLLNHPKCNSLDRSQALESMLVDAMSARNLEMVKIILSKYNQPDICSSVLAEDLNVFPSTPEIFTEILTYAKLFEEKAVYYVKQALAYGDLETAEGLMKDPRFTCSPDDLVEIKDTIAQIKAL